jgi:5'-nucleotidase (lipoprotein e(P4) family)
MKKIIILAIITLIASCAVQKSEPVVVQDSQDQLLLSVLWFQKSAEMKALYFQGYNIAQKSLAEKIKDQTSSRPKAVVMDIDETVLDNSPSEVYLIENNVRFSDEIWKKWVNTVSAKACPGALEFTKFAEAVNVEVFYVTNRDMPEELEPTMKNLKDAGFPYADVKHLVLKTDASSKEARRKILAEKYDILLFIGDNLADFDAVFDKRGPDLGFGAVSENKNKFGKDFIILPNPMYGPWVNTALKDAEGTTTREKILNMLEGF